jgi:hypothetical protein
LVVVKILFLSINLVGAMLRISRRFITDYALSREIRDLFRSQEYRKIVRIMETNAVRDKDLLEYYIKALVLSNDRGLTEKLRIQFESPPTPEVQNKPEDFLYRQGSNTLGTDRSSSINTSKGPTNNFASTEENLKEGRLHFVTTDVGQWNKELAKGQPIRVVLQEAWSWAKMARTLGTKIFYGILIMTGLSVVMEQQGGLKGGLV